MLTNPSIRANNFKFSKSIFPFLPCYLLVKFNLEEKARFCKLSVQFFASRDCINSFSIGILLYTGFTFEVPEHQSYIYILFFDRRVSRLRNFLLTGILPYTGFTFDFPEHQSYIYDILYYTAPVTTLQIRRSYTLSIYISLLLYIIYKINHRVPLSTRTNSVWRVSFCVARVSFY
jgi:hypothetical protein